MRRGNFKVRIFIFIAIAAFAYLRKCSQEEINPYTGKKQAISLSPQEEIAIGLQSAPGMAQQHGGLHPNNQYQALVDNVGNKLVNNSVAKDTPYQYEFHLLADENTINAFALPGGQIFITYALFSKLENQDQSQVATKYELDGQIIGFIESVSKPFCSTCNRARLSADGNLYTCLFASKGNDLKSLFRMGANQAEIRKAVETIWSKRTDAYSEQRGEESKPKVEMSFIGG